MERYIPIIGMEVHVELKTKSKMFGRAANTPDSPEANSAIDELDLAHPGTLPVPNKQAIAWTVLIGKALGCHIRDVSKFDRKHYFYPDLPKGYQISQYDEPIAEKGQMVLHFELEDNHRDVARIGIERAHLEEDTAKLLHDTDGSTLANFNRSGVPLVEIVTQPDFQSGMEAKKYCQELQLLLRHLEVSDADMEKGHMRCEANISVQKAGTFEIVDGIVKPINDHVLFPKVELKNLNSFKAVERGIAYEIDRQTNMIERGERWIQQTRGWNEKEGKTVMQREKETAADYRYFPEPDIPPFNPLQVAGEIRLPELPQAKRRRFHEEYGFSYADAYMLTQDKRWATFTEQVMSELIDWLYTQPEVKGATDDIQEQKKQKIARLAGGWLTTKLVGQLSTCGKKLPELALSPENFAELISLVYTDKVNSTNAQKMLAIMVASDKDQDPSHILEEKGWGQVQDTAALEKVVDDVIINYPAQVEAFKSGKDPIIKFLIGMAMKATEGTANPTMVEELLRKKLTS